MNEIEKIKFSVRYSGLNRRSVFAFSQFFFLLFISFTCVAAQKVSGIVTDTDLAPIQNAEITLFEQAKKISQTLTASDGGFSVDLGGLQNPTLQVKAEGFAPFSKVLAGNFAEPLRIVLSPAAIAEDVTVSITRNETRLSETPASVAVLDRKTLDATAAQTPDDWLRQIAGFNLFRRASSKTVNPTAQGANLRGLAGSGASRAEVLLDGLSINDSFGGWTYWSRVPRAAVQKIEVLRGGASQFYGASALSGAIEFSTLEPRENAPVLRLETSAGTQNTFDASLFASYTDKTGWGFDAAAETFKTDGYIPVAETDRGAVDRRAGSRHDNVFFTVEKRFNETGAEKTRGKTGIFNEARIFLRGGYFTENRQNGTRLQTNQTRFRQAAFGADFFNEKFGAFRLRSFAEKQIYDQTFSAVSDDRNAENLVRVQRVPSDAFGANLFWNQVFGDHQAAFSLEFRQTRGFSDETGFFNERATSASSSGGSQRAFSVFAQDDWRVNGKLNLNFGARFDVWRNFDALSATTNLTTNQINVVIFPNRSETAFSPRLAAIYRLRQNFSLYGSYSKSFRAPTLNELYRGFRVGSVVTLPNENLRPEIADTFETGLIFASFANRLNIRGNFFHAKVSDPVVSVTLTTTPALITRRRQNVGETRAQGLELDAEFAPRPDWRFSASYLLVDSRVTKFPANRELVGKFLPQVAGQQLAFQVFYRPPEKFSAALQARFSAVQFEDDLNTLRLRPFFTLDASAAYRLSKNFEIFAAVENVFNNRYDIGRTPVLTVAAPLSARIGVRFDLTEK
jgi:outer membrane receptor protein involved in Fe transport